MLQVADLRSGYGRIEALHGISFEARAGEVTCLIGPNGAGKSTTLFTLAGVVRARSGQVRLDNRELSRLTPPEIVRCGLSLVPENRLIFQGLSVQDNLRMGAYQRLHTDRAGVARDIDRMLDYFPPLRDRLSQEAGTMSGGEQQMLAVARALMANPKMLMLDEPSLGLAPLVVAEIFEILHTLHQDGVSILLVEQNVQWALSCAQHIIVLELGQVVFDGDPDAFSASDVIQQAYLGRRDNGS